jgi:cation:H+ antiporter
MLAFPFFLFVIGVALVIKGADWLVDGSSSLARRLGVSDLAIGLTVVAFGTSLPELTVNVFAVIQNQPEVAIGNVTGSNICNILLVLGGSALLCPIYVQRSTVWKEIPFSLLAQLLLLVMAMDTVLDGAGINILSRTEGFSLLGMFTIFLTYIAGMAKDLPQITEAEEHRTIPPVKSAVFILLGLGLLIIGGKLVVEGAVAIAEQLNLGKGFVAVTLVAVGTSLPELATSLVAAYKKKADIAVGNVVGSNIFNIFLILGISSTLYPIPVPSDMTLSLYVGIIATVILFATLFVGKRHCIGRWEGAVMLAMYVIYLILQPR